MTGDVLREIASESGFEADEEGNSVIDHLNFDVELDSGKHTLIAADPANLIDSEPIVGDKKALGPILYEGTGLMVDNENPLVLEILTASSTAYSHNPDEPISEYPHATGKNHYISTYIGLFQNHPSLKLRCKTASQNASQS